MFKQIVVGTDGSATASEAVRRAANLAVTYDARLHLVTAYRPAMPGTGAELAFVAGAPMVFDAPEADAERSAQAAEMLRRTVEGLPVKVAQTETHVRPGDAADVILDVAEENGADLIVVGNKGMTGARRFLLGSVPNKVSHHAPCNVMIVRTT